MRTICADTACCTLEMGGKDIATLLVTASVTFSRVSKEHAFDCLTYFSLPPSCASEAVHSITFILILVLVITHIAIIALISILLIIPILIPNLLLPKTLLGSAAAEIIVIDQICAFRQTKYLRMGKRIGVTGRS